MLGKTLCIGAGAMGGALLRGAFKQAVLRPSDTTVVVRRIEHCKALADELGVNALVDMPDAGDYEIIILAVKPQVLPEVLAGLTGVKPTTVIISVAAGITLDALKQALPSGILFRAMPNMPAAIGAGMTALTPSDAPPDTVEAVSALFKAVGEVVIVSEEDLDRLGALSGAGPGYMFVILDALADAGVRIGLRRDVAVRAAAQTMYGSGLMALTQGMHPAALRDQVTSPGGTTIAGIGAMEKGGLRSALQDGVLACLARTQELGK